MDDDAAGFVDPGSLGCGKGGMAEPGTGVLVCFPGLLLVSPVSLLMSPVLLLMSLTPVSLFSLSLLLLLLDVLDCLSVSFANTCTGSPLPLCGISFLSHCSFPWLVVLVLLICLSALVSLVPEVVNPPESIWLVKLALPLPS